MSAGVSSGGSGKPGSQSQDFELNLASIIDCFTVLVTFLLASSAFLAIGILDAGIAAGGATTPDNKAPPSVQVAVDLMPGHKMELRVTGKVSQTVSIAAATGNAWDYARLNSELSQIKAKFPDVSGVTLKAEESIEYGEVISSMEAIRRSIPAVLLGGF